MRVLFFLVLFSVSLAVAEGIEVETENVVKEKEILKIQNAKIPVSTVIEQSPIQTTEKFSIEAFNYEEYAYSNSKKTEVGDQVELTTRFRYQFNENGWASLGFSTVPEENRFENKTSDFEVRAGYNFKKLFVQVDLTLNTTDEEGGTTVGPDLDSENSFITYRFTDDLQLTFFPFNFDSSVGVEFNTDEVARVLFVDNAPSVINPTPNEDDRLISKTIPGFELRYSQINKRGYGNSFYAGVGTATYLYPNDPSFDITRSSNALNWSRNESVGYKAGAVSRGMNHFLSLQYVGHTEDEETGSLLRSAASLYSLNRLGGKFMVEFEATASEAGSQPYRLNSSRDWFETGSPIGVDPFQRVYRDRDGNIQDWVGEWGWATSLRAGIIRKGYTPYLSYKYHDENFVFRERESAHLLRTARETGSHGGLHRVGFGAYLYKGNFIVNPRFEYLIAQNDVFSDRNAVTDSQIISGFTDTDFSFFLGVSYFFDKRTGPRTFRL